MQGSPTVQRKCANCEEEAKLQRQEAEKEESVQRKEISFNGSDLIVTQRKCASCEEDNIQRQEMDDEESLQKIKIRIYRRGFSALV